MAQTISKMETIQTAVEWLVDKLLKGEFINNPDELIQQAKGMEKEQIEKAYASGSNDRLHNFINEQYYKETHGKTMH